MKNSIFLLLVSAGISFGVSAADTKTFKCGAHLIEVSDLSANEYSGVSLRFLDKDKKPVAPEVKGGGRVVPLCKRKRLLLLDINTQYLPGDSILLSDDGKVILKENFGEIDDSGQSDDDKIFWIESKVTEKDASSVTLKVYSSAGKRLADKTFTQETDYALEFEGVKYKIHVIEPDYPG